MWLENITKTILEEKDKRKTMLKFHRAKSKVSNTIGKGGKPQRNIKLESSNYNDKKSENIFLFFFYDLRLRNVFHRCQTCDQITTHV